MKQLLVAIILLWVCRISTYSQQSPGPDPVTVVSDSTNMIEASFTGSSKEWSVYIEKKIGSYNPADSGAPVGLYPTIVRFIVDSTGKVSAIEPETSNGYGMERTLIKAIAGTDRWKPATINGKPVNAYKRQTVSFLVSSADLDISSELNYSLFAGRANEVSIITTDISPQDLEVTVSEGTIAPTGAGKFVITNIEKPGRVLIEVYNTRKKRKLIGKISMQVILPDQKK